MNRSEYHDVLERIEAQLGDLRNQISVYKKADHGMHALSDEKRQNILEAEALDAEILIRYVKRITIASDETVHIIEFTFS